MSPPSSNATEPLENGRAKRKHKALVAYLLSSGLTSTEDEHPIVANATVSEFNLAMAEVTRRTRCPLTAAFKKWTATGPLSVGCAATEWMPIRQMRFRNLKSFEYRYGYTLLVGNAVEIFQICYRQNSVTNGGNILYHVQSLTCNEAPSYYRLQYNRRGGITECVRLLNLDPGVYAPKRNPTGAIPDNARIMLMKHPDIEPVNPDHMPLHEIISQFRS